MPTAADKRAAREAAIRETNEDAMRNPGSVPDAHGEIAKPQSAGAKVVVACKLGVAYFSIQLCKMIDVEEQTQTGLRTIKKAERIGEVVRLRGTAYPRGVVPDGFPEKPAMANGAALNYGIDKDWFDEWLRQNHKNPIVMNKMVFAHEDEQDVRAEAKELSKFLSGLEPVNPKNDPRISRSTRAEVSNIETEETFAAKRARLVTEG
jgi:hypothetical protein